MKRNVRLIVCGGEGLRPITPGLMAYLQVRRRPVADATGALPSHSPLLISANKVIE